jgi:hypothetical protein
MNANIKHSTRPHIDRLRNLGRDAKNGEAEANFLRALNRKQEMRHRRQMWEVLGGSEDITSLKIATTAKF